MSAEFDFGGVDSEVLDDMLGPPDVPADDNAPVDEPDASLLDKPKRAPKAVTYEKRIRKAEGIYIQACLRRPATVPDAATMLIYGPNFAEKWGDLAAGDKRIQRAVDLLGDATDSPLLAAIAATTPLLLQLARNHEPVLQPAPRQFTVPLLRGRKLGVRLPKFGIKLGFMRNVAHDPDELTVKVLSNPDVQERLAKLGIRLVDPPV